MAFMEPQYEHGTFVYVRENPDSDYDPSDRAIPADEYEPGLHGAEYAREEGWFYRFSAPGYLDCTDWYGPYDSEQEARDRVMEDGLDPDTGDELLPEED